MNIKIITLSMRHLNISDTMYFMNFTILSC